MLISTAEALDQIRERIAETLAGDRRYTLAEVDDDLASLIARQQVDTHRATDLHVYDWLEEGDFGPLSVTEDDLIDLGVQAERLAAPAA